METVDYLLIGPRAELAKYRSYFTKMGRIVVIFDPWENEIKKGIAFLKQVSGAVVTFGPRSLPIDAEFIETLTEIVKKKKIPSILVAQPDLCSFTDTIEQIAKVSNN